jgi:hypothetical protein
VDTDATGPVDDSVLSEMVEAGLVEPVPVGDGSEAGPVVLNINGNRVAFLKHFADGLFPVVGRRYAFACVAVENGGPEETDEHSASFRLVRVY